MYSVTLQSPVFHQMQEIFPTGQMSWQRYKEVVQEIIEDVLGEDGDPENQVMVNAVFPSIDVFVGTWLFLEGSIAHLNIFCECGIAPAEHTVHYGDGSKSLKKRVAFQNHSGYGTCAPTMDHALEQLSKFTGYDMARELNEAITDGADVIVRRDPHGHAVSKWTNERHLNRCENDLSIFLDTEDTYTPTPRAVLWFPWNDTPAQTRVFVSAPKMVTLPYEAAYALHDPSEKVWGPKKDALCPF